MKYDYKRYQLNSYRHGLITQDKLFGRPTIFFNCETQHESITKLNDYHDLHSRHTHNIICLPVDLTGNETGDNYEIYFYHENNLGSKFHINEKLNIEHLFFKDFGVPATNFTNYIFDDNLNFVSRVDTLTGVVNV